MDVIEMEGESQRLAFSDMRRSPKSGKYRRWRIAEANVSLVVGGIAWASIQ